MIDSFKHKGLRSRLVDSLVEKGITDEKVLAAMRKVPRHLFIENALDDAAYEDRPLPIAENQTISQPYTVAYQTALLQIKKGHKVLEIGTGSGYQCAILCEMQAKVFTIETHRNLYIQAQRVLAELDYAPTMRCGDGSIGWEEHAAFDRILVTAACPSIPEPLKKQLNIGGKLVLPVGSADMQEMCLVTRKSAQEWEVKRLEKFRFVPLTGKNGFKI